MIHALTYLCTVINHFARISVIYRLIIYIRNTSRRKQRWLQRKLSTYPTNITITPHTAANTTLVRHPATLNTHIYHNDVLKMYLGAKVS